MRIIPPMLLQPVVSCINKGTKPQGDINWNLKLLSSYFSVSHLPKC